MVPTIIFLVCAAALALAAVNFFRVKKMDAGDEKMQEISGAIALGARSFLLAEYRIMFLFIVLVAALIAVFLDRPGTAVANSGLYTAIAFVVGAIASIVSGAIGMWVATLANVRTTQAARTSVERAFFVAFTGGSVLGLSLVSFAILGILILFLVFQGMGFSTTLTVEVLTGYALGGSMMALFGRVGGGIYTKAADVGADLVGKVEVGIPEDDPRNPAVIADNVGDNVGDIAGMGSDLFGSAAESTCASLVIGALAFGDDLTAVLFPVLVSAVGIAASMVSLFFIRVAKGSENVERPIKTGLVLSTILMGVALVPVTRWALPPYFALHGRAYSADGVLFSLLAGLFSGLLIGLVTEYYTSGTYRPVKKTADAALTGAGTLLIEGIALGYESAILPVVLIAGTAVFSFINAGLYGVSVSALGMLGTLVMALTIDVYGPISDNAGGIAEMSELPREVRGRTDVLDAAGNTTAAIGKGFAIGSAALTAFALFSAFVAEAGITTVNILHYPIIGAILIGALLPFIFSSMTMKAVGRAAQAIVVEVRRQFKEIPGLMQGTGKPDYKRCIGISTVGALREMLAPGVMIIFSPVVVGLAFGVDVLAGFLAGAFASGIVLAVSMANSGGGWDNAKKLIEKGLHGGKGSAAHKAAVVGDTVGDPFKDTSGPSLNILVKLMAITSLVLVPLFLRVKPFLGGLIGR